MSIKSEGGRAFPSNYVEQEGPNKGMQMVAGGMTRRQWLAGKIAASMWANPDPPKGPSEKPFVDIVAERAYAQADAMLAHEAKETRK